MSKAGRRKLGIGELQDQLETADDGRLYWKGRPLRTAGWSTSERIAAAAALIALLALLVNLADVSGKRRAGGDADATQVESDVGQ